MAPLGAWRTPAHTIMRTILVTGSDTGIGKTQVVAALVRLLRSSGGSVQVVKVVETGVGEGEEGDAGRACRLTGAGAIPATLLSFPAALAPAAAAAAAGRTVRLEQLIEKLRALPPCDWRICEGAGGIASPIDDLGRDWVDFAQAAAVEATVIVVPDRIGGINQGRLAFARAAGGGLHAGVWLNAAAPVEPAVAASNRAGLLAAGVPLWAAQAHGAEAPGDPALLLTFLEVETRLRSASPWQATRSTLGARCCEILAERDRKNLRRTLRVTAFPAGALNLADNDYLDLARDPAVTSAAAAGVERDGTSASASPLITGWRTAHAQLVEELCAWHGFSSGLLWSSGYAANAAILGTLPREGDLVLADRLIHHSMIAGLLRSGARLVRYPHLNLDELERRLGEVTWDSAHDPRSHGLKPMSLSTPPAVFVVTESLFSMDGDYPDLARMAALKRRFGFCWIVDEAHALGWYGPEGAGLVRAAGVEAEVDVLVGTLGKTLAAGGAYALFRDEAVREALVNTAGEFIYSTAIPPANAAAAQAALGRVRQLAGGQPQWHSASRAFRAALRADGWAAPDGESPIVPVRLDDENAALALAGALRTAGIYAAAVRPPTVPAGTSRLRFSLKRTFGRAEGERVLAAMRGWREQKGSAGVPPADGERAGGTPAPPKDRS